MLAAPPVAAQTADPIAGYVIDLRGATSGLPRETVYFPGIPLDTIVPARGFGFDVGGHVFVLKLGSARVGLGANYLRVRGTAEGVATNVSTIAPQVSFNFGSANGWSYLSAGLGRAWVVTDTDVAASSPTDPPTGPTTEPATGPTTTETGGITSVNYGGGARWFLRRRVAAGFDVRVHRLSGPSRETLVSVSVGLSVR
jgi:hypothetical protein